MACAMPFCFCFCFASYFAIFICYLFLLLVGVRGGDKGDGVLEDGFDSALLVLGVYFDLHGDTVLGAAVG